MVMQGVLAGVTAVAALSSALLLYGASRHCLWRGLHGRLGRAGAIGGWLLAAVGFGCAIVAHGVSAGVCYALAVWMVGLVAWPYLAWATSPRVLP